MPLHRASSIGPESPASLCNTMNRKRACRSLSLFAIAGLFGLGCVAVPRPVAQSLAGSPDAFSCRDISVSGTAQTYCGSSGQWQEYDRRMALRDAGVTCRNARTPQERCLSARQWARVDRMAANGAQSATFGSEAQGAAAQQSAGLEQVRQQWFQATGLPYPGLPPPASRQ